jgi:hypothetical protein
MSVLREMIIIMQVHIIYGDCGIAGLNQHFFAACVLLVEISTSKNRVVLL